MTGVRGHKVVKTDDGYVCSCGHELDRNRDVARQVMNAHRIDLRASSEECEQCGEPAKYRNPPLCAKHYQRWKAHGDFDLHNGPRNCWEEGCQAPVKAYGWCARHYHRIKRYGDTADRKWHRRGSDRCVVPGCGGAHLSMGLCKKHYDRENKRGHPLWRTLGNQKVHQDRPWTPDTVRDPARLQLAWQRMLTQPRRSSHTDQGDDVTDELPPRDCPDCEETVVPIICGERMGEVVCQDLICPECGETLEDRAS